MSSPSLDLATLQQFMQSRAHAVLDKALAHYFEQSLNSMIEVEYSVPDISAETCDTIVSQRPSLMVSQLENGQNGCAQSVITIATEMDFYRQL